MIVLITIFESKVNVAYIDETLMKFKPVRVSIVEAESTKT